MGALKDGLTAGIMCSVSRIRRCLPALDLCFTLSGLVFASLASFGAPSEIGLAKLASFCSLRASVSKEGVLDGKGGGSVGAVETVNVYLTLTGLCIVHELLPTASDAPDSTEFRMLPTHLLSGANRSVVPVKPSHVTSRCYYYDNWQKDDASLCAAVPDIKHMIVGANCTPGYWEPVHSGDLCTLIALGKSIDVPGVVASCDACYSVARKATNLNVEAAGLLGRMCNNAVDWIKDLAVLVCALFCGLFKLVFACAHWCCGDDVRWHGAANTLFAVLCVVSLATLLVSFSLRDYPAAIQSVFEQLEVDGVSFHLGWGPGFVAALFAAGSFSAATVFAARAFYCRMRVIEYTHTNGLMASPLLAPSRVRVRYTISGQTG